MAHDMNTMLATLQPLVSRMRQDVSWSRRPQDPFPGRTDKALTAERLTRHCGEGPWLGAAFMQPGSTVCAAALLDLDSHKGNTPWADMVGIARSIAEDLFLEGIRVAPFRSSGGHGVHLYAVWATPQDAYSVRRALFASLARVGLKPGTAGVAEGEVEVFPKQDQVRPGGYGNMAILPLANLSAPIDLADGTVYPRDHPVVWRDSSPVDVLEHEVREYTAAGTTAEIADLRAALTAIPQETSPLEYDEWRNIIFAIHYGTDGSDDGLALAHEFSARAPGKYDPEFLDNRVWPYINGDGGITDRYILWMAEQNGFNPTQASDFDGLGEPEASPCGAPKRRRFEPVQAAEFAASISPVTWLIRHLIPAAELVAVFGASGSGKSFMVLDLAMAVARGVEWRGMKVTQTRVLYVAAEGKEGMKRRVQAYARHHGIDVAQVDISFITDVPSLLSANDVSEMINVWSEGGAGLVILDTLARVTAGADENSGEDMGKAIKNAGRIHAALGATVLVVHHSGKDESKGSRGWSGIKGALDAELEVVRAGDERVLSVTKQKDGEEGQSYPFRLQDVDLGWAEDEEPVKSCVVVESRAEARTTHARRKLGKVEAAVYDALVDLGPGRHEEDTLIDAVSLVMPTTRRANVTRAIQALLAGGMLDQDGDEMLSIPGPKDET